METNDNPLHPTLRWKTEPCNWTASYKCNNSTALQNVLYVHKVYTVMFQSCTYNRWRKWQI